MHEKCSCVRCTLAFGQQLANLFHTWCEFSRPVRSNLGELISDVQASIWALKCLQDLIDEDKRASDDAPKVFTPAALDEVGALGLKCDLLFKAAILLIQRAVETKSPGSSQGEDENKTMPIMDLNPDLLTGPVPDLDSPKTLSLYAWLDNHRWKWLAERVTHCQEQLRWVRTGLVLQLQIARLARLQQSRPADCEDGAFEYEFVARNAVMITSISRMKFTRKHARKQEKAQRLRDLEGKREEDETASVTSARTAVDENEPVGKSTADKDNSAVKVEQPPNPTAMPPPPVVQRMLARLPGDGRSNNTVQDVQPSDIKVVTSTHVEMAQGGKEARSTTALVSTSINNLGQKVSETMTEFKHKIFGKDDEFTKDWESQELEAWVTQNLPYDDPVKVPFGHRRLQYGLKQVSRKKSDTLGFTTFHRYVNQSGRVQIMLEEMTTEANRMQKRERVCLAFQHYARPDGTSFVIAFFSILEEKPPIAFTDCIGRKMSLPYKTCKTWEGMRDIINNAFMHVPDIGPHVLEDHYDVLNAKGETILHTLWNTAVKPGDTLKMMLWPMESHPLRGFYGQPPFQLPHAGFGALHRRQRRLALWPAGPVPGPRPVPHGVPLPMTTGPPRTVPMGPPAFPPAQRPWPRATMPPMAGEMRSVELGEAAARRPRRCRPISITTSSSRSSSEDHKHAMTREERERLTFVDYVEELERAKGLTVPKLLARFTNLKDVNGGRFFESDNGGEEFHAGYSRDWSGSDSDSGSSSGSSSFVCD